MGQRAKHPVAPTIRGAFLRALDIIKDEEGLTFSQLMYAEIKKHGLLAVMDKVGRYQERESSVDVATTHEHAHVSLSATDDFLERVLSEIESDKEQGNVQSVVLATEVLEPEKIGPEAGIKSIPTVLDDAPVHGTIPFTTNEAAKVVSEQ